ncbi:MAG: FISUMP domain-containing protein, partial [Bacteroidales bacterium]
TAGGYRLRFALNNDDTIAANEAKIRVVSRYQTYFSCKGCGAAGSDVIVDSTSIHPDCPYKNVNYDLLACSKRTGGAKNWEGFMVDHRDCKIYRMVAMPHIASYNKGQGRWWMAQNLNYTKNLINNANSTIAPTILGCYYCPNGLSFNGRPGYSGNTVSNPNTPTNIAEACNTYGAVYGLPTTMSPNGLAPTQDAITTENSYSIAQGICPKGWVIPGRKDFAVMINKVAGCTDDAKAQTAVPANSVKDAPCHHLHNSSVGTSHVPSAVFTDVTLFLRSTLSDRMSSPIDSVFSSATKPTWAWYSIGSKRQHGTRPIDYYGFSTLPSGRLGYAGASYNYYTNVGYAADFRTSTAGGGYDEAVYMNYNQRFYHIHNFEATQYAFPLRCVRSYNLDQ